MYSPKQWRAINHFYTSKNLCPTLGVFPYVIGVDKETGVETKMHISNVENDYIVDTRKERANKTEQAKRVRTNN